MSTLRDQADTKLPNFVRENTFDVLPLETHLTVFVLYKSADHFDGRQYTHAIASNHCKHLA